jgi:hypothetical protein
MTSAGVFAVLSRFSACTEFVVGGAAPNTIGCRGIEQPEARRTDAAAYKREIVRGLSFILSDNLLLFWSFVWKKRGQQESVRQVACLLK